jgi:hypothetical protein
MDHYQHCGLHSYKKRLKISSLRHKDYILNGDLDVEVFMEIPEGVDSNDDTTARGQDRKVCKLLKSLYGSGMRK